MLVRPSLVIYDSVKIIGLFFKRALQKRLQSGSPKSCSPMYIRQFVLNLLHPQNPSRAETRISRYLAVQIQTEIKPLRRRAPSGQVPTHAGKNSGVYLSGGIKFGAQNPGVYLGLPDLGI